jgi:hypothetical protein
VKSHRRPGFSACVPQNPGGPLAAYNAPCVRPLHIGTIAVTRKNAPFTGSDGGGDTTLRNWRSMRIGPSFVNVGKGVLYPIGELDAWDRKNVVPCRASR